MQVVNQMPLSAEKLFGKTSSEAGESPKRIPSAGRLVSTRTGQACTKKGAGTGDGWDVCGTPAAAARDLEDPEKLQTAQIFFCCKCKGWTAAHQLPRLSPELLQGDTSCFPSLSPATPQAQSQQRQVPAGLLQAPGPAAGVSTVRGSTALHFHLQRALQR